MFRYVLSIAATAMLCACSHSESKDIEQIAYDYAMATSEYRLDDAEQYVTVETRNTSFPIMRQLAEAVGEEYLAADSPATVVITKIMKVNDTVAKAVYHKTTPQKDFTDTLRLRKRDGQWLIHMPSHITKSPAQSANPDTTRDRVVRNFTLPNNAIKQKQTKK